MGAEDAGNAGGYRNADVDVCVDEVADVGVDAILSSVRDGTPSNESARSEATRRYLVGGEALSCIVKGIKG